ncbi:hypothetical protein BH10ACI4_BH10ACI4_34050 [soil metagenome]
MRWILRVVLLTAFGSLAFGQQSASRTAKASAEQPAGSYVGFDRNEYPGDAALPVLRKHFSFVGYWLTNPPGSRSNNWVGKRAALREQGFGFLVLANGRFDTEILKAKKTSGLSAEALGKKDAANAVAAAEREHFPAGTIIFLDQEQGGRLLPVQADYLFGWTEAVSRSAYKPGGYMSGQAVGDGPGKTITTAQDVREQVAAKHLHPVALWVYDDACPPSNGCMLQPPAFRGSGAGPGLLQGALQDVVVWQYAQSPRRKENTAACSKTYDAAGNCVVSELPAIHLDLNVARTADPSHGR